MRVYIYFKVFKGKGREIRCSFKGRRDYYGKKILKIVILEKSWGYEC